MKKIVISLINFYQIFLSFDSGLLRFLAPGGACLYNVRCSEYTKQMILKYGVIKGIKLGSVRVLLCNQVFNWIPAFAGMTRNSGMTKEKEKYV